MRMLAMQCVVTDRRGSLSVSVAAVNRSVTRRIRRWDRALIEAGTPLDAAPDDGDPPDEGLAARIQIGGSRLRMRGTYVEGDTPIRA